jgi:hypothetical protein
MILHAKSGKIQLNLVFMTPESGADLVSQKITVVEVPQADVELLLRTDFSEAGSNRRTGDRGLGHWGQLKGRGEEHADGLHARNAALGPRIEFRLRWASGFPVQVMGAKPVHLESEHTRPSWIISCRARRHLVRWKLFQN